MDCLRGDTSATLICYQDGARDDMPVSFWLREKIDPLETLALELCREHVLDVGTGAEKRKRLISTNSMADLLTRSPLSATAWTKSGSSPTY